MLRLEKEVRKRLSQRVHDVVEEYLSGVQARPVSSDFPPRGPDSPFGSPLTEGLLGRAENAGCFAYARTTTGAGPSAAPGSRRCSTR